ncbi:AMMECR1 domain-containing protein [archaeon]|jgi:AmmeMemoRadiSam system protein A|nr:AMMECR1 domain-containing protein [archaeon]MDP6547763.1 AmmeMemoRadiSam system protein A [Candidatus Woesearchaeota archaeon]|tara:strand:- start:57592 stop:58140 length:549 start_codon:yes stop_codon:yes gene_type:complete
MITEKEQKFLLELARNAIIRYPGNVDIDENKIPKKLKEKKGIFVTLNLNDELRGCIGNLLPSDSIYKSVIENAVNAAYNDYRFTEVTKKEIDSLKIEISILTEPVKLNFIDSNNLLKKLDKKEGVILKKGQKMATFLPQVWEQINDKEEFLEHLCMKAGLNGDSWKNGDIEIDTYRVEKFGE